MPALRAERARRRPRAARARLQPLQAPRRGGAARSFLKRAFFVALGWAWAGAIVWLSLTSSPPQVDFRHSDKVGHVLAYAILMLWFSQLYARRIFYAAAFIAMGVALEFIQGMTPYRTFEYFDMAANAAGVLLGWALALITRKIVPR